MSHFYLRMHSKADTPIEEFTPTPAFPALQYLESVDEGGVAWEAGLRTGDFLIEVGRISVLLESNLTFDSADPYLNNSPMQSFLSIELHASVIECDV